MSPQFYLAERSRDNGHVVAAADIHDMAVVVMGLIESDSVDFLVRAIARVFGS